MRNDAGWMVCEQRTGRVVVLSLGESQAATLAAILNVASLCAPVTDYERAAKSALARPRLQRRSAATRKSVS